MKYPIIIHPKFEIEIFDNMLHEYDLKISFVMKQ